MSNDPYESDDIESSYEQKEKEKTTRANSSSTSVKVTSEVFDSSLSDSMTDIRESATMDETETKRVLADNEKLESINPEATRFKSTVNPTRPKERASAATKQLGQRKREGENKGRQNIKQKEAALTGIPKQLDKQSTQINKIIQILQPAQKRFKSVERDDIHNLFKRLQFANLLRDLIKHSPCCIKIDMSEGALPMISKVGIKE
ncbi:MAG TPA: hypothetical protein VFD60_01405 [Nitrososphaeraceae archaeon]|jgi:hypothetical protein|nr:hypothetical protein [Nitrososphaeraceae archaeon]